MATTQKALELARAIREALALRLATNSVVVDSDISFDTDESPYFQVGTGIAGAKGGIIKVRPIVWPLAKDIFGNTATIFTPHVIQIVTEGNPIGGGGADVNDYPTLIAMLGEAIVHGTKVEWYMTANTVAPVAASIIAGNLKASFDNLYFPMVSSQ
jgi:hypothetical protein